MHILNSEDITNYGNLKDYLDIEKELEIAGWVHNTRDHGGVIFLDLRNHDNELLQVVSEINEIIDKLSKLSLESIVKIKGFVRKREAETINNSIKNGDIEFVANSCEEISKAIYLPFNVNNNDEINDQIKQKYRYLHLRRSQEKETIQKRSQIISFIRRFMENEDFLEIQTPILTATSPEGARDFVVPSRLHKQKYYALPQAPQIFKQLLMVGGFKKYFQIAPCFRDEDSRSDRSPGEFYQLDFEISFATRPQVLGLLQKLMQNLFGKFASKPLLHEEFPLISYEDSMNRYGSDKPDLRNEVYIEDVTELFRNTEFTIFREKINEGCLVKAFVLPACDQEGIERKSRSFFDKTLEYWKKLEHLMAYTYVQDGEWMGPIAKFIPEKMPFGQNGIFFICNKPKILRKVCGRIRHYIGQEGNYINKTVHSLAFIVDFPMFEYDDEEKKWDFSHNPFSMPKTPVEEIDPNNLESVISNQYDMVCDGYEVCSGAIRNHNTELFKKICYMVGYDEDYINKHFSCLLNAFQYGVPPHGGAAPGIERLIMILLGRDSIREVIPFPLLQNGIDLMMDAPKELSAKQLKELGIKFV